MQSLEVTRDLAGILLADFLQRTFPDADRARLRQICQSGAVRVNGLEAAPTDRLRVGALVLVEADAADLARSARTGSPAMPGVLFEGEHCLVIDKPAGVPTVPDRAGVAGIHGLLSRLRPHADLRIAHRLDRDTSGCLVLAKGREGARHLDAEFRAGRVQKEYLALVHGVPIAERTEVELCLGPDPRRPGKVIAAPQPRRGFRAARTEILCQRRFADLALVRLWPRTGRGHQLRVHCSAVGHPIVGDADYGGGPLLLSALKRRYKQRVGVAERPLLERMFLHAERIRFTDRDGTEVDVQAPLPRELRVALDRLERFAAGRGS